MASDGWVRLSTFGYWHTGTAGNRREFDRPLMAYRVLVAGAMDAQWKKLARPAVAGFLLGLVVTTALAVAASAAGVGATPAHVAR